MLLLITLRAFVIAGFLLGIMLYAITKKHEPRVADFFAGFAACSGWFGLISAVLPE